MNKKLKSFTAYFRIDHVSSMFIDERDKYMQMLNKLSCDNPNTFGEITYKIIDKARHAFHRYYRGHLLPILAQCKAPENDNIWTPDLYRMHWELKQRFLFEELKNGWESVPDRVMKKGIAILELNKIDRNIDNFSNFNIPSGRTLIILNFDLPIAMIKSHAVLTEHEARCFLLDCEMLRDGMTGWEMTEKDLEQRRQIFGDF